MRDLPVMFQAVTLYGSAHPISRAMARTVANPAASECTVQYLPGLTTTAATIIRKQPFPTRHLWSGADFHQKEEIAAAGVKSGESLATCLEGSTEPPNIKFEQLHAELCIFFAGACWRRSPLFKLHFIWSCYFGESPHRKARDCHCIVIHQSEQSGLNCGRFLWINGRFIGVVCVCGSTTTLYDVARAFSALYAA